MTRIEDTFARLAARKQKAFVAFVMAGDPDLETSLAVMRGLPEAGVDVLDPGGEGSEALALAGCDLDRVGEPRPQGLAARVVRPVAEPVVHGARDERGGVHLDQARLGERCIVGRAAYIGTGVELGDDCKVQNLALVYEPARLGRGVFIGPGVVLTNDTYPRAVNPDLSQKSGDDWDAVGVDIGDGAAIGARSVCVAPMRIGAWALVAAGLALMATAAVTMLRAGATVDPTRQPTALVTHGIFRLSRNPIYLGDVLIVAGLCLVWQPLAALVLVPGFLVISQLLTIGTVQVMFGWAKPVPVHAERLRDPRTGMMLVALAGPGMNLALALVGALLLGIFAHWVGEPADGSAAAFLGANLINFLLINVFLALFNLIPLPPFDGGHVVAGLLPERAALQWDKLARFGFPLLIILLLVLPALVPGANIVQRLVAPPAQALTQAYLTIAAAIA